uniref:Uncharacterized protein n=1 Tax=Arundo donax TaxID=35708 RepID=A0A0A9ED98_ARUDO
MILNWKLRQTKPHANILKQNIQMPTNYKTTTCLQTGTRSYKGL